MRMCCDFRWFNSCHKLCTLELRANGKVKCIFEYTIAGKRYKKKQEI